MTRRRHGIKVLGLAVFAALGLIAFSAAVAQGSFLILGITLEQLELEEETFAGNVDEPFSFLVESKNYEINCPEVNVTGTLLLTDADAKLAFFKCAVFTMEAPLEELTACHVSEPMTEKRTIFLNTLILTVLHKTKEGDGQEQLLTFLLAESLPGNKALGAIHINKEAGCTLPETLNVTGTIALTINQGDAIFNLIMAGGDPLQLLLGDELSLNKNAAHLDGSFWAELTGAFKGCKWGAI